MSQLTLAVKKPRTTGFTMIELLIVVAIIGIMASLAIPRMSGNAEKARASEAKVALGVIQRLQNDHRNSTGAYLTIPTAPASAVTAAFQTLGIDVPNSTLFTYACTAPPNCTATRTTASGGSTANTATIDVSTRQFTCTGVYSQTGSASGPCV